MKESPREQQVMRSRKYMHGMLKMIRIIDRWGAYKTASTEIWLVIIGLEETRRYIRLDD